MKNRVGDLRDHLFETLEALKDTDHPMDVDRALAVAQVADRIIATAKVEVDYAKITGQRLGSDFLPEEDEKPGGPRRLGA